MNAAPFGAVGDVIPVLVRVLQDVTSVEVAAQPNKAKHILLTLAFITDSLAFFCCTAGLIMVKTTPAKIPIITITSKSSMSVKPFFIDMLRFHLLCIHNLHTFGQASCKYSWNKCCLPNFLMLITRSKGVNRPILN